MLQGPVLGLEEGVLSKKRAMYIQRDLCKTIPNNFFPPPTSIAQR